MSITGIAILLFSLFALVFVGRWVINALVVMARYLGFKEFVVAFFTVSIGAVAPEFFVGISAALQGVPEVSLGNVIGENLFLLTVTVALCTFFTAKGLAVNSKTVQGGIVFTTLAAILPLFLIINGELSRLDGFILLSCFGLFLFWLFSKKERFMKIYRHDEPHLEEDVTRTTFLRSVAVALGGVAVIVFAADLLLGELLTFSEGMGIPLAALGLFVVAIGTALPETYFAVNLARHGESWMVLGGIMGGVALASTLVLGVVALIHPISLTTADVSTLVLARIFLTIGALLLLIFVTTGHTITKREGMALLAVYISFLLAEIVII